ncbi:MAG TPA: hypothetical protein PK280_20745 [Planctomycetota bacterium]|nr:hypothetical protein [Planctomycetota bacterium]
MPETAPPAPEGEPRRQERGLLWFYLLLGLAAAVFAAGALAWRPLRASQWEGRARAAYERGDVKAAGDALDALDALGPAAGPAVGRLLEPNRAWYRGQVIQQLGRKENRWMLPALVRLARHDTDAAVVRLSVSAAESMSGRIFFPLSTPPGAAGGAAAGLDEARRRLIDWWEAEGSRRHRP